MEITTQTIKQLREKTGAGMMDCQKALKETAGDMEKAIELLRKKGAATAIQRADKIANQGLIITKINSGSTKAVILEINSETDFVARNEEFVSFGNLLADVLLVSTPENMEKFLAMNLPTGKTVNDTLSELVSKIGEKLDVKRFNVISSENGIVDCYTHLGSKIGVLVEIKATLSPETKTLARDISLQVAAMNPMVASREEMPKEKIDSELEIYRQLAKNEGKPEQIAEKIATGRLEKYFQEVVLNEQIFIKDSTKSIKDVVAEIGKSKNEEIKISRFIRYQLGETK